MTETKSTFASRSQEVAALIERMMALPNDPYSRREMKAAGRDALALLRVESEQGWQNVPPRSPSSAGTCGQHGAFVGPSCPKCVTQVTRG